MNSKFWLNKRVFITGHTGFKGSWLTLWLLKMGAKVTGFSLEPPTSQNLYELANIDAGVDSIFGDVRDLAMLKRSIKCSNPDIVFHMAAQSLVRRSYDQPIETFTTNAIGTLNILEALRDCSSVRSMVVVTTDKCYENHEWIWGYREIDRLGGKDPYSNSKACAELITQSYRDSFFSSQNQKSSCFIATARAGNVIGGGDWAADRLIPDLIYAFENNQSPEIRNPKSTRPWQHVLEPLRGYLLLAEKLYSHGEGFASSWNFGPKSSDIRSVEWVVNTFRDLWGPTAPPVSTSNNLNSPHEATLLHLDITKSKTFLGWEPLIDVDHALFLTADWSKRSLNSENVREITLSQINYYESLIQSKP
jgi:CDP-glucose 4,6-dehydratase